MLCMYKKCTPEVVRNARIKVITSCRELCTKVGFVNTVGNALESTVAGLYLLLCQPPYTRYHHDNQLTTPQCPTAMDV